MDSGRLVSAMTAPAQRPSPSGKAVRVDNSGALESGHARPEPLILPQRFAQGSHEAYYPGRLESAFVERYQVGASGFGWFVALAGRLDCNLLTLMSQTPAIRRDGCAAWGTTSPCEASSLSAPVLDVVHFAHSRVRTRRPQPGMEQPGREEGLEGSPAERERAPLMPPPVLSSQVGRSVQRASPRPA